MTISAKDLLILLWEESEYWQEESDIAIQLNGRMSNDSRHYLKITDEVLGELLERAGIKPGPQQSNLEALARESSLSLTV